jgi:starch-binding outer membrane protein, SusD/RagB family
VHNLASDPTKLNNIYMRKYFAIIITALAMASCHKKLDIPNPNAPDASDFWGTADNALRGVNAVYAAQIKTGTMARWNHFGFTIRSDEGFNVSPAPVLFNLSKFIIADYDNFISNDLYKHNYVGINRANQVIAYVPGITMDDNLKKRYIAEAKFLRALYYWNLVTLFGDVPIITVPGTGSFKPENKTTTISDVWALIEKDLTEAAPDLPETYDAANVGRATRGAASALLGKAYLQQKKYQQAADAFKWLIDREGTLYELVPYKWNFDQAHENNKESVYEVQFSRGGNTYMNEDNPNSELGSQRPRFFSPDGFLDGFMHGWVVDEFMKEKTILGAEDPRLDVSLFHAYTDPRGPDFSMAYGRTWNQLNGDPVIPRNSARSIKFTRYDTDPGEDWASPVNIRVIRYADVLLMYAEALNGLNRTGDAYPYVNKVRARANLAPLTPGMNATQFLEQLKHERVLELSGEETRWADLARWGYFDDAGKVAELRQRDYEFQNFVPGKSGWLPIPTLEISINAEGMEQNPGW